MVDLDGHTNRKEQNEQRKDDRQHKTSEASSLPQLKEMFHVEQKAKP